MYSRTSSSFSPWYPQVYRATSLRGSDKTHISAGKLMVICEGGQIPESAWGITWYTYDSNRIPPHSWTIIVRKRTHTKLHINTCSYSKHTEHVTINHGINLSKQRRCLMRSYFCSRFEWSIEPFLNRLRLYYFRYYRFGICLAYTASQTVIRPP